MAGTKVKKNHEYKHYSVDQYEMTVLAKTEIRHWLYTLSGAFFLHAHIIFLQILVWNFETTHVRETKKEQF